MPGRALLVGIPLTIGAIAVASRWILGLGWLQSLLLGAVLSPTDPVMTRAILEHDAVPLKLRRFEIAEADRPLVGFAIACTIFGICKLTGDNEFLAAYAAGVTLTTIREDLASAFARVGEPISEAIKLAALRGREPRRRERA